MHNSYNYGGTKYESGGTKKVSYVSSSGGKQSYQSNMNVSRMVKNPSNSSVTSTDAKKQAQKAAPRTVAKPVSGTSRALADWKVPDRYEVKHLIGSGSYGHVCEACDHNTKNIVAIKRIHHVFEDLIDCKRILREIAILNRLKHSNVVSIIDIIPPPDFHNFNELYVVLEIADSDFKKLLRSPVNLSEVHIQTLLYNLLIGLKFVHSAGVFHRDLKPANCLVNQDCTVKICDFGLARTMEKPDAPSNASAIDNLNEDRAVSRQLTGHVVTRWYRAPELILLQQNYTEAIDMWSVGCIFAELLGTMDENCASVFDRRPLFPGSSCFPLSPDQKNGRGERFDKKNQDQLGMIFDIIGTPSEEDMDFLEKPDAKKYIRMFSKSQKRSLYERFPGGSREGVTLLEKMLVFNPSKRITVDEALAHPYFRKVRSNSTEAKANAASTVQLPFNDWANLDEFELRREFLNEIKVFHPEIVVPNFADKKK